MLPVGHIKHYSNVISTKNCVHIHILQPVHCIDVNTLDFYSDINECVQSLAGCNQNCTNTAGGYFCTCMNGYELQSDNVTCTGNVYNWFCDYGIITFRVHIYSTE